MATIEPDLRRNPSFASELVSFLVERKKWYLIPIGVALLLFGLLVVLGGSAAAPFIYTVF
jgi:hypothetical protein